MSKEAPIVVLINGISTEPFNLQKFKDSMKAQHQDYEIIGDLKDGVKAAELERRIKRIRRDNPGREITLFVNAHGLEQKGEDTRVNSLPLGEDVSDISDFFKIVNKSGINENDSIYIDACNSGGFIDHAHNMLPRGVRVGLSSDYYQTAQFPHSNIAVAEMANQSKQRMDADYLADMIAKAVSLGDKKDFTSNSEPLVITTGNKKSSFSYEEALEQAFARKDKIANLQYDDLPKAHNVLDRVEFERAKKAILDNNYESFRFKVSVKPEKASDVCPYGEALVLSKYFCEKEGVDANRTSLDRSIAHFDDYFGKGYNPNIQLRKGDNTVTPLSLAIDNQDLEMVKYLWDQGARVQAGVKRVYKNPETVNEVTESIAKAQPEILKFFLSKGYSPNMKTYENGENLLMQAIGENGEAFNVLIKHGADPNQPDDDGKNAFFYAIKNGRFVELEPFIKDGDCGVDKMGRNICHELAQTYVDNDNIKIAKKYSDINAKDNDGNTPLMIAAKRGDVYSYQRLLDEGADKSLTNKKGQTAESLMSDDVKTTHKLMLLMEKAEKSGVLTKDELSVVDSYQMQLEFHSDDQKPTKKGLNNAIEEVRNMMKSGCQVTIDEVNPDPKIPIQHTLWHNITHIFSK